MGKKSNKVFKKKIFFLKNILNISKSVLPPSKISYFYIYMFQ